MVGCGVAGAGVDVGAVRVGVGATAVVGAAVGTVAVRVAVGANDEVPVGGGAPHAAATRSTTNPTPMETQRLTIATPHHKE